MKILANLALSFFFGSFKKGLTTVLCIIGFILGWILYDKIKDAVKKVNGYDELLQDVKMQKKFVGDIQGLLLLAVSKNKADSLKTYTIIKAQKDSMQVDRNNAAFHQSITYNLQTTIQQIHKKLKMCEAENIEVVKQNEELKLKKKK